MRFRRTRSLLITCVVLSVICLHHVYYRNTPCSTVQRIQDDINPMQVGEPRVQSATLNPYDRPSQHKIDRKHISPDILLKGIHLPLLNNNLQKPDKSTLHFAHDQISRQSRQLPKVPSQQSSVAVWPIRRNFRPNFYLTNSSSLLNLSNRTSLAAENDVIIYMHHNKAAGSTTKDCIGKVAFSTGRHLGPVQDSMGRLNVHNLIGRFPDFKHEHNILMGGYAFGLCDEFNASCSYFTILREPYERTISSYSYCRRARSDQLCSALNAGKVSLREWALHQGSFLFRQLLFDPIFCRHFYDHTAFSNLSKIPHEFARSKAGFTGAPCWFRQKVVFHHAFNQTQMDNVLQYALQNLENWFTVIGLVQEYDLSLAMLQEAYGLPFHTRCSGQKINVSDYKNMQTDSAKRNTNGTRTDIVNENIRELMSDPEVRQVLEADVQLYERALEIFDQQKRTFFKLLEQREKKQ
ncbi:uncharacterized protein [Amphiura filiformis]|uniref:uncharacterized protein n=1 Tax=Amphiura filiformis TaxID=82378 RepID=UPI003B21AAE1